ncbi:hypothetical protein Psi02_40220 [Planotetraspora silvatica]|uniref:CBM2 domain-containing protein n=1 Tax=Planotetraspora silvatica TaxID=234614 RepID=A0A8J3XSR7_9ACTN|nr:hypothetical protein [Planotetraspora silvatica]GII47598.1 hypothetical protein Psi02_40220 [Planotetraspora silvatica]
MGRHAAEHQGGAGHPPLPDDGTSAAIRSGDPAEGRQEGEQTRRSAGLSGDAALGDAPSKGLRRLALVSGVSVVLTLGLIVGGVRVLSGRTELTVQSSGASCAAPDQCRAERTADTAPTDGRRTSDGPASPTPTISAGQTPRGSHSATPGVTPGPVTSTTASATPGTTAVPEPGESPTRAVTQTPGTTPSASSPVLGAAPPPSPDGEASVPATTQPAAPNRVRVSVELFSRGYRAEVTVHNEAADLDSWAVDLPLGAKIAGAYSTQGGVDTRGNTITSSRPLRSGRDITVTIYGFGSFRSPGGCSLAGGECTVSSGRR